MRAFLALALLSTLALGACDSDPAGEEMPPPEEVLEPLSFEYRVDAPAGITDFGITYTGADGNTVTVSTTPPFAFPFVENVGPLPLETRGAYGVRLFGFVSSGGAVARVRATRDGLLVAEAQVIGEPEANGFVDATAILVIREDGTIEGE